jgi:hypothetical protein
MPQHPDDASSHEGDGLGEIAGILAAGILRLRKRVALAGASGNSPAPGNSAESAPNCLEVPAESRLSVHTG